MIRFAWLVLLAAIALVAGFAQIDRQARISPQLAPLVPPPLRGFSQYHLALAAAGRDDPAAALIEAQRLVARRPMVAEHLGLLSRARYQAGQQAAAIDSLRIAAGLGWRDASVQEAMLHLALATGDDAEAGRRLAAIWALSRDPARLGELAPAVLRTTGGRASFTAVLAHAAGWQARFERLGPEVLGGDLYAEVATEAVCCIPAHPNPQMAR